MSHHIKVDLEMESRPGGEDEYEDYEPDSYYENTRLNDPNGTLPKRPPVAPKPKNIVVKQEPYVDYREQDEYLIPRKTDVSATKIPQDVITETRNSPTPEVTFKKRFIGRRCKIVAVVCGMALAFILGGVLVFGVMYMKSIADTASEAMYFIIGHNPGRIAVMLTPQKHDTLVSVGVTPMDELPKFTNLDLAYEMDIKLGHSSLWSNTMVYDRAFTKTIWSIGDITVVMSMNTSGVNFSGDTTLMLSASTMATDYTVVLKKSLLNMCYIFTGNSSRTKISLTSSPYINVSSTFGFHPIDVGALNTLTLNGTDVDFTGLRVESDHPVAVIVATEHQMLDMVYPTHMLGKSGYIPHFEGNGNDTYTTQIKVLALSDDTEVVFDGTNKTTTTLDKGHFKEYVNDGHASVFCTKACSVVAFVQMQCPDHKPQAMVAIPPEDLFLSGKVYFAVGFGEQYANVNLAIVVENRAAGLDDLKLNGHAIDTTLITFANGKYLWTSIKSIEHGTHTLESKELKFMAYLYGIQCGRKHGAFAHVIGIRS